MTKTDLPKSETYLHKHGTVYRIDSNRQSSVLITPSVNVVGVQWYHLETDSLEKLIIGGGRHIGRTYL